MFVELTTDLGDIIKEHHYYICSKSFKAIDTKRDSSCIGLTFEINVKKTCHLIRILFKRLKYSYDTKVLFIPERDSPHSDH